MECRLSEWCQSIWLMNRYTGQAERNNRNENILLTDRSLQGTGTETKEIENTGVCFLRTSTFYTPSFLVRGKTIVSRVTDDLQASQWLLFLFVTVEGVRVLEKITIDPVLFPVKHPPREPTSEGYLFFYGSSLLSEENLHLSTRSKGNANQLYWLRVTV